MLLYMSCYWIFDLECTFWRSLNLAVVLMYSSYVSVLSYCRCVVPKIKYEMLKMRDISILSFILLYRSSIHMVYVKGGPQISALHSGGQSEMKISFQIIRCIFLISDLALTYVLHSECTQWFKVLRKNFIWGWWGDNLEKNMYKKYHQIHHPCGTDNLLFLRK